MHLPAAPDHTSRDGHETDPASERQAPPLHRRTAHVTFVSQAALAGGVGEPLALRRPLVEVNGARTVGKRDVVHNSATMEIEVDSQTYRVRADGQFLWCEPAEELPMAQRYLLF